VEKGICFQPGLLYFLMFFDQLSVFGSVDIDFRLCLLRAVMVSG
jgi:hypothetical protein